MSEEEIVNNDEIITNEEISAIEDESVLGGLIGDTFKLFFSDHNVIAAIVVSAIVVALLIIAIKFLKGRW